MNRIVYIQAKEEQRFQRFINKSLNPMSHLFPVMMQEGSTSKYLANRWTEIKSKIKLGIFMKEEQIKEVWDILEEF